jgi:hypothetical protein
MKGEEPGGHLMGRGKRGLWRDKEKRMCSFVVLFFETRQGLPFSLIKKKRIDRLISGK